MIRTQISMSEWEYRRSKDAARRLGISLAELLRRALLVMIPAPKTKAWMRYAGFVASGSPRSSRTIDDVIYGQKD